MSGDGTSGSTGELQRAIERLTASIATLEARVVLQAVYAADKEAAADRHRNLADRMEAVDRAAREEAGRIERRVLQEVGELRTSLEGRVDAAGRSAKDEITRLEKKVDADIADRKADRRLIIAAFLALVAQIILQVYEQAQAQGAPA